MKYSTIALLTLLVIFSNHVIGETKLTNQNVNVFLENVINSVNKKNADEFETYFSVDAIFKFQSSNKLGDINEIGIKEYINFLRKVWKSSAKTFYEVKDIKINIKNDLAIVTDLVIERVEVDGKIVIASKTEEISTIKIIDKKLKVIEVFATLMLET